MRCGLGMAVLAALAALLCDLRSACAEAGPLPVAVEFRADSGCPNVEAFLQRIQVRAPFQLRPQSPALHLVVELQAVSSGYRGTLEADATGAAASRVVSAATCEEVADALALIGALLIERTKQEQAQEQESRPSRPLEPRPPPSPATTSPPPVSVAQPSKRRAAIGAEIGSARPIAGAPPVGGALSLFVERGLSWWLSAGYLRNDWLTEPPRLKLAYGALSFGVGPPSFALSPRLRLAGALGGEGGFLAAESADAEVAVPVRRSYWAVGFLARCEWQVAGPAFLYAQGAAMVPLVERKFSTREPYERVGTTAILAPKLGLGFGLSL